MLLERTEEQALDSAQIVLDGAVLEEPFEIDGRKIRLSVSYGAAAASAGRSRAAALLAQRAEAALKRAKESGEHCLHYRVRR